MFVCESTFPVSVLRDFIRISLGLCDNKSTHDRYEVKCDRPQVESYR